MEINQLHHATHAGTDESEHNPLAGELMDIYVATLIIVPVALFLKTFVF